MGIACAAILALASTFPSATPPQKVSDALLELRMLGTIIEAYQNEFGHYPAPEQPLRPLSKVLKTEPGAYGTHAPGNDPWGRPYLYRANRSSYQVVTLGADGAPDHDYGTTLTGIGTFAPIRDTGSEEGDLVFSDGRFVTSFHGCR